MFVKNPGTVVELGGTRYVLPPLSLGVIEQLDDEKMAMLMGNTFEPARMRFLVDLMFEALKRNYPDLDRAIVSMNVDIGNIGAMLTGLLSASGLTKDEDAEEVPAGEPQATGPEAGST